MQKEIKDAYPKKVCHMLRHAKKIKMHNQRRYATYPQGLSKKQRERDNPYPKKKKKKQERDDSYKGVHPPSTKDIFTHTCTS